MENGCRKLLGTPNAEAFLVGLAGCLAALDFMYTARGGPNIIYANELILFMHIITYRKWNKYFVYNIIPTIGMGMSKCWENTKS